MRLHETLVPIVAALVSLSIVPIGGWSIEPMPAGASAEARSDGAGHSRLGQERVPAARMAEAAKPAAAQTAGPSRGQTLTGHWRSTTIAFERPRDEHLVLRADGTAETWIVTASDGTGSTRGRWSSQGTTLNVDWEDGRQWSQPFTSCEGQLVFPNIANRRQFWDLIQLP